MYLVSRYMCVPVSLPMILLNSILPYTVLGAELCPDESIEVLLC